MLVCCPRAGGARCAPKSVQGTPLPLQRVHDVHCDDCFASRVLRVGDTVADDVFQEHLQHAADLVVDEATEALDTTTTCQAPNGGLRDALDVVAQHAAVALGTALAVALDALATT